MLREEVSAIALLDAGANDDGPHGLDGLLRGLRALEVGRVLEELGERGSHARQLLLGRCERRKS